MLVYRVRVVGLRCDSPSSQILAHSSTVTRLSEGSTHSPRLRATCAAASQRSASLLRSKCLACSLPAPSRYLARHFPSGRLATFPATSGSSRAVVHQPASDDVRVVTEVFADTEGGGTGAEVAPLVEGGDGNGEERRDLWTVQSRAQVGGATGSGKCGTEGEVVLRGIWVLLDL